MQDDFGTEVVHPTMQQMWDRMDKLESGLVENTASTKRIEGNTGELIDILNSFKSAFKVLTWIGKIAKPVSAIIGMCLGIWAGILALKTGVSPK
jgi:hypothetical protein